MLTAEDGLPQEDGHELMVGIKQIQMEQDTARTQEQDNETSLIDFNRSGQPLIEIISLPHIHSPQAAAAYVRKVQALLSSVDAVTTGMELGGLRADVNVSVRRKGAEAGAFSYSGVGGLGQRTEIKNLSSFKGVEDAVTAERNRQIDVLEAGGAIEGETRGWSITSPGKTRRLRGKEGEVDYRYMPDPDIPPLYIGSDIIQHLRKTLPPSPQKLSRMLVDQYGLSEADAQSLLPLDNGDRLLYFQEVVDELHSLDSTHAENMKRHGKVVGNWVLHELGSLLSSSETPWSEILVPAKSLARIIDLQSTNKVTSTSAKQILRTIFEGDLASVDQIVQREGLSFNVMSNEEYEKLAGIVIEAHPSHVKDIVEKGKHGKIKFLVGRMMSHAEKGRIEAAKAEAMLRKQLLGT